MIARLIGLNWKKKLRSPIWAKNLLANIFLAFAALMLLFYAIALGFVLSFGLDEFFPDKDPIDLINGLLIYYFFVEFFLRFFLQNVPILSIQPFLHLPVRKSKIIHFMLRKSQLSVFNLLAFLIFTPFAFAKIGVEYGMYTGFMWWIMIIGLMFTVHFKTMYFKKKLNDIPNLFLIMLVTIAGIAALDYYGILTLSAVSALIFNSVLEIPPLASIAILGWLITYRMNFVYLKNNTYPEELTTYKANNKIAGEFAFLKRFGSIGELVIIELKLILRHKRPRNTLIFSAALLLYGLIFYPQKAYQEMDWMFLFIGVFVTGIFFINYGQFLLSWESGYFDFVLIRKASYRQYIESKYYLFVITCAISFLLSLGYGYFGLKIIGINLAAFLFNIGINIPLVMRIAMYSPKKIDLSKGAAFNYEGVGAAQFLIILPVIFLPYVIYGPFIAIDQESLGLAILGFIGLMGFLLRERIITYLTNTLIKNRHKIAAGFRAQ